MGILKGALSVRRYRVIGELPEGFRDRWIDTLNTHQFREPQSPTHKGEVMGWTQAHNLLDTDFTDLNQWLYDRYAYFALRVDKKSVPAKLLRAHLQKRLEAWCKANNRPKAPAAVREELKEALELELLQKCLPRVQTWEVLWHVNDGWAVFTNDAELPNERFQKLFLRTFGLRAVPWSPLDELTGTEGLAEALASAGTTDLRGRGA
ncbi:MAG: recombination-associated protein RdgC [Deltaproteobacteria bacterium]|nr:recombination-associated protein RdgC [Deltaproteobacteria bacterium]